MLDVLNIMLDVLKKYNNIYILYSASRYCCRCLNDSSKEDSRSAAGSDWSQLLAAASDRLALSVHGSPSLQGGPNIQGGLSGDSALSNTVVSSPACKPQTHSSVKVRRRGVAARFDVRPQPTANHSSLNTASSSSRHVQPQSITSQTDCGN